MHREVRDADFVLVIASAAYKRRAEGDAGLDEGRGVQWEAALIREEFYTDRDKGLAKFVPVVLPGQSAAAGIPAWLGPATSTHYVVPECPVTGAERLIRYQSGQPFEVEGPIGELPVLGSRGAASAGTPASGSGPAGAVLPVPGLRTPVLLRVSGAAGELVTEAVVAGTVLGTRRVPFPSGLTGVWAVLRETPAVAADGMVAAGRALTGALLDEATSR